MPFELIVKTLAPFFVTRLIYAGAGKVGAENQTSPVEFQISQRADFFECLVDLNTMVKRPIVNSRDEPHADYGKYRRLHVIVGDANMAELSTYLKVGTLAIVPGSHRGRGRGSPDRTRGSRSRYQAGFAGLDDEGYAQAHGRPIDNGLEIQRAYLKAAMNFYACHELNQITKDVLVRWEDVLDKLERDPRSLAQELDWAAKRHMIESYMERKGCGWNDPRVRLMDLQYHDIRPDKGLYYTLERSHLIERVVQDVEMTRAEFTPPLVRGPTSADVVLENSPNRSMGQAGPPCCSTSATRRLRRFH